MKKYDNYVDSDIEWLGNIPEHWKVTKLKFIGDAIGGLTYSPNDVVEDEEQGVLVLRSSNIQHGKLSLKDNVFVNLKISDKLTLKKGDILICSRNGSQHLIGKNICIDERTEGCTFGAFMMIFRSKYFGFLNHFFNSPIFTSQSGLFLTATINQLTSSTLNNFYIAIPDSIHEQTQIANYLDHKTTQIDTLITKKEQFIILLQEERTAVINQAVTKGLDQKVKMKDSGIEWLGEIPEHWKVKRLRNLVETIKTGSTPPSEEIQYFEPNEINWYGPGDFDSLILGNSKRKISKLAIEENKCRLFPANSILLIGIGATVGKVGLALEDCSSNQQLNAIIMKNQYNSIFYLYFLSTIKDIIVMEASSATLPIFNQTQTKNIITPVPPSKEQVEIANFIAKKELEIKSIILKTQQEIELLKEYKTALISEVVTGKVDVRDVVLN